MAFVVLIILVVAVISLNLYVKGLHIEEEELKNDPHSWWP